MTRRVAAPLDLEIIDVLGIDPRSLVARDVGVWNLDLRLVGEWTTVALAQVDAENRYRLRAARGQPEAGLALLDKLDRSLRRRAPAKKK